MHIEKNKSDLKTVIGSFFTLLIYSVVALYMFQKIDVWLAKKDVDIMSSTQTGFFNDSYTFDFDQGLNFAIAFTAYDDDREYLLDKSYGEIVFRAYEWGINEDDGKSFVR